MNIEHIDQAIAIMERAKRYRQHFNMEYYQNNEYHRLDGRRLKQAKTESELHECGNTACFAGWVAISPEWKAFGGIVGIDGYPVLLNYKNKNGNISNYLSYEAIAIWLGIDTNLAYSMIAGDVDRDGFSAFYRKLFELVTPEDVIAVLELIKRSTITVMTSL